MGQPDGVTGSRDESVNDLMAALHAEVRSIASRQLANENTGHTLQPTALANEAYLRMLDQANLRGATPAEFLAAATKTIRRILIDHARQKKADKRGGARTRISLEGAEQSGLDQGLELLELDDALKKLASEDRRVCQVAMLKVYSGMTSEEIAQTMNVSVRTVMSEWAIAREWLLKTLAN